MKSIFKKGDRRKFQRVVSSEDTAAFSAGEVHPVFSTFAVARDAEWTCRQFVLEMKDDDEEGIGTSVVVEHKSPALIGETVNFTAEILEISQNKIVCFYEAKVNERVIATGNQTQKILKKEKIEELFKKLKNE